MLLALSNGSDFLKIVIMGHNVINQSDIWVKFCPMNQCIIGCIKVRQLHVNEMEYNGVEN